MDLPIQKQGKRHFMTLELRVRTLKTFFNKEGQPFLCQTAQPNKKSLKPRKRIKSKLTQPTRMGLLQISAPGLKL
jgi:hypothetical protein